MAPSEDPSPSPENQPRRRVFRPRRRRCLLKGCRGKFRPQHPLARYCSAACREQARQWRMWKAQRRYRQSTNGQQKRNAQCCRYRERSKPGTKNPPRQPTRGSSPKKFFLCSCDRPGCYVEFHHTRRSPLQRFCSLSCRHALERVRERERCWRKRHPNQEEKGTREKARLLSP